MRCPLVARAVLALSVAACGAPEDLPERGGGLTTLRQEVRPTEVNSSAMWRYQPGDAVESHDSPGGGFRVHYTRAGKNAVPSADLNANGVPDFVEQTARVYDEVRAFYAGPMGLRSPLGDASLPGDNGGNGRFDVYLLDFGGAADGTLQVDQCLAANPDVCVGYIVQENDFAGYGYPSTLVATRILASHEFFHAVQAAYDRLQGAVLDEGTAVWASEQFDPSLEDFESFLGGFLSRPDRSLDLPPPGPVPSFAYGSAIFFQYLTERFERALVRKIWERCENGNGLPGPGVDTANPYWMSQLDLILRADYTSAFSPAFVDFARWNLYTGPGADPAKGYKGGAVYPQPAMTAVTAPYREVPLRVFYASAAYYKVSPAGRAYMTAALVDDPAAPGDESEGLALELVVRIAGAIRTMTGVPVPGAGEVSVNTAGATDMVVLIVNGALGGQSKKPGLCVGTANEVASCRTEINPSLADAGPVADAGLDAGVEDAGVPADGGGAAPPPGCGCGAPPTGAIAPTVLAGLIAVRVCSQRRCRRSREA